MLQTLIIKNLAVIAAVRVDFAAGLNVLTGETGAGKSIIVDALDLLLGGRASANMLRAGEVSASIEGYFDVTPENETALMEILAPLGFETLDGGGLLVRREIYATGRGRFFVNDKGVMAATLRRLQPFLIEIYGQGESYTLTSARWQMDLLDEFGGCRGARRAVREAYAEWRAASEELGKAERDEAERERTAEFLKYQLEAIREVNPQPSESVELEAERRVLRHGERVLKACAEAYAALYESDQSALEKLSVVRRRVQELSEIDATFNTVFESLEAARMVLDETARELNEYQSRMDFSPMRLAEIENRLVELERLRRKVGCDLAELPALREKLAGDLTRLEKLDDLKTELRARLKSAVRRYAERAKKLSAHRHAAAPLLEQSVMRELEQLAMERTQFKVEIKTRKLKDTNDSFGEREEFAEWSPVGSDNVEFLLAANIGEGLHSLARIASGGELSRLMLALRTCVQQRAPERVRERAKMNGGVNGDAGLTPLAQPTLIFDEIDAGIGGRVAQSVGKRLKDLAARRQVLCVTHQPQLARFADAHFVVTKDVAESRTVTNVQHLDEKGRIDELARMIGGAKEIETARATARWMLENEMLENGRRENEKTGGRSPRRNARRKRV